MIDAGMIASKEVKRFLKKVDRANKRRKPGDTMLEFTLIVKQPPGAKELIRIITGTVPASFRFRPRTP